jgi:hypothetical protein
LICSQSAVVVLKKEKLAPLAICAEMPGLAFLHKSKFIQKIRIRVTIKMNPARVSLLFFLGGG